MTARGSGDSGQYLSSPWVMAGGLILIGLVTRLIGIGDHPPRTDELFHIIVGRSWAENGTLAMADGSYDRARYYSIATGIMFKLFGTGIAEARALGAIGGALQVMALGLWVRSVANARAGWIAALLLCFNYVAIGEAQSARFYSWHALASWLFAISAYALVTGGVAMARARTAGLVIVAVASIASAKHLQNMTPIIVASVGAWALLRLLINGRLDFIARSPVRIAALLAIIILGAVITYLSAWRFVTEQWAYFRRTPAWAEESASSQSFYIQELAYGLSWMFSLFPVAAMIAWRRYRDPALFCAVVFLVALVFHSAGGMKAMRYVHYLFPFIFALWGLALAASWGAITRFLSELAPGWPARRRTALQAALIGGTAAIALLCANQYRNTAIAAAALVKTGSPDVNFGGRWALEEVDWTPYLPELRKLMRYDVFIATDMTRTIYYLGDYDVLLNRSEQSDVGTDEFMWDDRTGRTDISRASSVALLMRCYATGSLLVSESKIGSADIPAETVELIQREMQAIPLPKPLGMRAYVWHRTPDSASPACLKMYDEGYVPERPGRMPPSGAPAETR